MDNTAIDAIAALSAKNTELTTDIPAIVIPKNTELTSLEKLMEKPARYRAQFTTTLADEFIEYCNNQKRGALICIDPETMTARAIFDAGTPDSPGWGQHSAQLKSKQTPSFTAVKRFNGTRLSQQDFIDFAEDWAPYITFVDENFYDIEFKKAISSIRRLSVHHTKKGESDIHNFNNSRSAMESVEVTAANEQKPPAGIVLRAPMFEGFQVIHLNLDIRAVIKDEKIYLMYRISELDGSMTEMSEIFKEFLKSEIDGDVMIGTISYQNI